MTGLTKSCVGQGMAVLLVATALLAGCSDASAPIRGVAGLPVQQTAKVITKDAALKRKARLVQLKVERTEADLLRVRLGILNHDDDSLWIDIQVLFYDADGFELEKTNWQPLLLQTDQVTYFDTVSLSSQARDYNVFLRNARETESE